MCRLSVLVPAILAISVSQAAAATVDVNGDLAEWGVTLNATTKQLEFAPGMTNNPVHPGALGIVDNFLGAGGKMFYHAEDSDDGSSGGYVGPNRGGQNYDAEFLGAAILDSVLYVGIATGQRPDNGSTLFGPGDVQIQTNMGLFGVEVGGGAGTDSGPAGGQIVLGADGTTYDLTGNGYTIPPQNDLPLQTAGSLWKTDLTDWIKDPIDPKIEVQINGGTSAGTASAYVYDYALAYGQHAFIEISLPLSLFGPGAKIENIAWRPSCGNDELEVPYPEESPPVVPEPASLLVWSLLASLAVGCCWQRCSGRKRR